MSGSMKMCVIDSLPVRFTLGLQNDTLNRQATRTRLLFATDRLTFAFIDMIRIFRSNSRCRYPIVSAPTTSSTNISIRY